MRIALSGAGGFLGSHLAERLIVEGHAVRALLRSDNAPSRAPSVWRSPRSTPERDGLVADCEIVFHAAGLVTGVVDHSRARRDLGYDPAVVVREGVERTARWYEQAGWL
jgi:nucleoside-diphosphate-sugar epimerase